MGLGFSALFGYCGYLIDSGNTTTGHKFALGNLIFFLYFKLWTSNFNL